MGDACLGSDGPGGGFVVAGEHHNIQLQRLHSFHSSLRIRFQHIGSGNSAKVLPFFIAEMQRGLSLRCQFRVIRNGNAQFLHQPSVAAVAADTPDRSRHTPAGKGLKIRNLGIGITAHFLEDRLGKRMLGAAFQCGGDPHEVAGIGLAGEDVGNLRLAGGKGSGLVQNYGIDMVEVFQCLSILKEHTHLGAPSGAHHNGNRGSKAQSTGAGDHQHGNGTVQAEFQAVASQHPNSKGNCRNGHDHGNENTRNFVRQPGNGGFGTTGFLHHADHLGQGGIFAHLVCPKFQIAFGIDGSGSNTVAGKLFHGHTFAGKGTLVHRGPALQHSAVYGNAAAGTDDDGVSQLDLFHGNFQFCSIPADGSRLGA